jgi:hypothetical protein
VGHFEFSPESLRLRRHGVHDIFFVDIPICLDVGTSRQHQTDIIGRQTPLECTFRPRLISFVPTTRGAPPVHGNREKLDTYGSPDYTHPYSVEHSPILSVLKTFNGVSPLVHLSTCRPPARIGRRRWGGRPTECLSY